MSTVEGQSEEYVIHAIMDEGARGTSEGMSVDRYQALQQHLLKRVSSSIDSIRIDCLGSFTAAAQRHSHVDHDSYVWAIDTLNKVTDIHGLWDWLCDVNMMISCGAKRLNSYWFLIGYVREGGVLIEKHADEFEGFLLSNQEIAILRSGSWSIDRWDRICTDSARKTERRRSRILW